MTARSEPASDSAAERRVTVEHRTESESQRHIILRRHAVIGLILDCFEAITIDLATAGFGLIETPCIGAEHGDDGFALAHQRSKSPQQPLTGGFGHQDPERGDGLFGLLSAAPEIDGDISAFFRKPDGNALADAG